MPTYKSPMHRIAIAGFGNVGRSVARLVSDHHPSASGVVITGVSDIRFGTVMSNDGLEPSELVAAAESGTFEEVDGYTKGSGVLEMIDQCPADTFVELTVTDLDTGQPAFTYVSRALERGLNVSTTNKGPIALHYETLMSLARSNGVLVGFEGTVMSGTPALRLARAIKHAGCGAVSGILNGTTNYVISRMEGGMEYGDALLEARELGYAEADPSADVDGRDIAAKLSILAHVMAGVPISISEVERVPLATVTHADIAHSVEHAERWRYIGSLEESEGAWRASVAPQRLPVSDPLASVSGTTNAITFHTELLGDVVISGPGAGRAETAFAVLSDLGHIKSRSVVRQLSDASADGPFA